VFVCLCLCVFDGLGSQYNTILFCLAAFAKIDVDSNGVLNLKDIAAKYNTSKHPDVTTGKKTSAQVYNEFIRGFMEDKSSSSLMLGANAGKKAAQAMFQPSAAMTGGAAGAAAALPDVSVNEEEFTSYYTDLSASIPGDDDLFALIMCNCWGISEVSAPALPCLALPYLLAWFACAHSLM
jgi:hypothetical protein